jgi:hypothetical protein
MDAFLDETKCIEYAILSVKNRKLWKMRLVDRPQDQASPEREGCLDAEYYNLSLNCPFCSCGLHDLRLRDLTLDRRGKRMAVAKAKKPI